MVDTALPLCYCIRVGQEDTTMDIRELETLWTFWNVGGRWTGRRQTGQTVRGGTRAAVLRAAEHFEQYPW